MTRSDVLRWRLTHVSRRIQSVDVAVKDEREACRRRGLCEEAIDAHLAGFHFERDRLIDWMAELNAEAHADEMSRR